MPKNARDKELARSAERREQQKRSARRKQSALKTVGLIAAFVAVVLLGFALLPGKSEKAAPSRSGGPVPGRPSAPSPTPSGDFPCDTTAPTISPAKYQESKPPPMIIDTSQDYKVTINTGCGMMKVELFAKQSPVTVNNFVSLAQKHWYNGLIFHRVDSSIDIIQTGDPTCTTQSAACGTGGPGYTIPDEYENGLKFKIGSLAMANTGQPNSGGSQIFIITGQKGLDLPPAYTIFGQLKGKNSLETAKLIQSVPVGGPTEQAPTQPVYILGVKISPKV